MKIVIFLLFFTGFIYSWMSRHEIYTVEQKVIKRSIASVTGKINLSGKISPFYQINIYPHSNSQNIDIINGVSNFYIGDVEEISNDINGYTIQASSENGGQLINNKDATFSVQYKFQYGSNTNLNLTKNPQSISTVYFLNQLSNIRKQVKITTQPIPNAIDGSYIDTITFSIISN